MYLRPKSEIEIGDIKLHGDNSGINSVEIEQSVKELMQSARITMPLMVINGKNKTMKYDI